MAMESKTVIEIARKVAGLSQQQLADWAGTQQSSVSEYESRRKSPTLDVVERLLEAADAELAIKPIIDFEVREDPELGTYVVPDRLWSVPMPDCFSKVQVLKYVLKTDDHRMWDLSVEADRVGYFEWAIVHGTAELLLDSLDGILLMQVWPRLDLPDVIREDWQPVIDAATVSQDTPPRDPGGLSAYIAKEIGVDWPPPRRRRR